MLGTSVTGLSKALQLSQITGSALSREHRRRPIRIKSSATRNELSTSALVRYFCSPSSGTGQGTASTWTSQIARLPCGSRSF